MMRAMMILLALAVPANAKTIRTDLGGDVGRYGNRIAAMAGAGQTVTIDGTCLSACTMYLAVGCVTNDARLGFHAPAGKGRKLDAEQVAFWSGVIASHYPPAVADWYLSGPVNSKRVVTLTGAELVAMGARGCP